MSSYLSSDRVQEAAGQKSVRRTLDQLRSMIRTGDLPVQEKIIEDRLMTLLGVGRSTVREALNRLAEEGAISRQRREGTHVIRRLVPLTMGDIVPGNSTMPFAVTRTDCRRTRSTPLIRQKLRTDAETVGVVEHCFYSGPTPVGIRTAYYDAEYEQPEGWQRCPTLAEAFQSVYGVRLGKVHTTVSVTACIPTVAAMLEVRTGSPALMLEQVIEDAEGNPREFVYSHYRQGATFEF